MPRLPVSVIIFGALAFLGGNACTSGRDGRLNVDAGEASAPAWGCPERDLKASQTFAEAWSSAMVPCSSDSDCVLDTRDIACPSGGGFNFCDVARHVDDTAAFSAAVQASANAACTPDSAGCYGSSFCGDADARCVSGGCTAVSPVVSDDAGTP